MFITKILFWFVHKSFLCGHNTPSIAVLTQGKVKAALGDKFLERSTLQDTSDVQESRCLYL